MSKHRPKKPEPPMPSVEEVKRQFAERGMPVNEWKERPEGMLGVPDTLTQSKEGLVKIRDHLQQQVKADQHALAAAMEELKRLEHGGAAGGR